MDAFKYINGELHTEEVSVLTLAETYGTPLYVYSRGHMLAQYRALAAALADLNPQLYYAVKANSNAAVIALFAGEGAGADVVSGGELVRALRSGIPAERIVFAGVGKTESEIYLALEEGIHLFTVESEPELDRISVCARSLGKTARVALRVNPDVDPKTHRYTSTGKAESKFGIDLERAEQACAQAMDLPGLELSGLHMHLGSPLMTVDPYVEAIRKVTPFCRRWQERCPTFRHLDVGGGLGIPYREGEAAPSAEDFAAAVVPLLKPLGMHIGFEPGRFLTGNGGILVTRVEYIKNNPLKQFVIIDASMTELIRPALYQAYHGLLPVRETSGTVFGDVVGPVCESGDFLAHERDLPAVQPGDHLAVMSAGAYGAVMASTYNSRPLPAEVMVSGNRHEVIRHRQLIENMFDQERVPEWGG